MQSSTKEVNLSHLDIKGSGCQTERWITSQSPAMPDLAMKSLIVLYIIQIIYKILFFCVWSSLQCFQTCAENDHIQNIIIILAQERSLFINLLNHSETSLNNFIYGSYNIP